jgi:hypothetical protein
MADEPRIDIRTHGFRRVTRDGETRSADTLDEITLADGRTVWRIAPIAGSVPPEVAESASPVVNRYLRSVVAKQERQARRATVHPAPKPAPDRRPKKLAAAPTTVPCPRCDGEARAGCPLCEGAGEVSPMEAEAWWEEHN